MKNLNQFMLFDWKTFSDGKRFRVTGTSEWKDYDSGNHLGTKVEVAIVEDRTQYKPDKNGNVQTNSYEKFPVKVAKNVSVPVGAFVALDGVTATVYGEYRNQLSVKAQDIHVLTAHKE